MNRYVADGVLDDFLAGKHVLVLTETRSGIRDAMDCVLDRLRKPDGTLPTLVLVHRTNGNEHIRGPLSTSRVTFHSVRSSLRGLSPDVIVLDTGDYALDYDWWVEFQHTVARKAEVIRR